MHRKTTIQSTLLLVGSLLLAAHAATRTWDGDTSVSWSDPANWDVPPNDNTNDDIANFSAPTTFAPNVGTVSIAGITASTAVTFSGTQLTIGASGINTSGSLVFNNPINIILGDDQEWSITSSTSYVKRNIALSGFDLTINTSGSTTNKRFAMDGGASGQGISGTGTVIKNGGGWMNLETGTYTPSGGFDIQAGRFGARVNLGTTVNVASGAEFLYSENNASSISVFGLSGSGLVRDGNNSARTLTINTANATSYDYSGNFSGTSGGGVGSLIKSGLGTQIFSGNVNSYTGTTDVSNGILVFSGNKTGTGGVSVGASGTLQIGNGGASGDIAAVNAITNNGALTFNRSGALAFENDISGSGSVTHNGSGTTTLSGIRTYTGATTVNTGTLVLDGGSHTGGTGSSYVVSAGANLTHGSGAWSTDLFHVDGAGGAINVASLALSTSGDSELRFSLDAGSSVSTVDLSGPNPFSQYGNDPSLWAADWTFTFFAPGLTSVDFVDQNLISSSGGFDLTDLSGLLTFDAYDSEGQVMTYTNVGNGQRIYIAGTGSVGSYTVSFTETGIDLIFGSSRAIPEPSVLGLLALAAGMLRHRLGARFTS